MEILRKIIGRLALKLFKVWEFFGLHVVPDNFYYPIPSTRDLDEAVFERESECIGLDWNIDTQKRYLREVFPAFTLEREFQINPGLSLVDAAILHCMIRRHKPEKMIEIGSGSSTEIAARACLMNRAEGSPCELIAIEPYPGKALMKGFPGLTTLKRERVQSVGVEAFEECDLLFVDSSHVVMTGSDVNYIQLEILPRLKKGCLIHFHDILLPGEYWRDWVKKRHIFWSEQYLLQAFLLFNHSFEVIWASRYMHLKNEKDIKAVFPFFEPGPGKHRITSFWIRRKESDIRP